MERQHEASQLGLALPARHPYSPEYLIPHTGISTAVDCFERVQVALSANVGSFHPVFLFGPSGSGKTHLAESFRSSLQKNGMPSESFAVFEFSSRASGDDVSDSIVSAFIAAYERLKAAGGVLLATANLSARELTSNPHLLSRLLASEPIQIEYPKEEELEPLFRSLAERRNLRLSDRSTDFLLKRLPSDPLSFAAILGKIDELSLSQGRPATLSLIRQVV